jgi:hypothetical protein
MREEGMPVAEIALNLERTSKAVSARLRILEEKKSEMSSASVSIPDEHPTFASIEHTGRLVAGDRVKLSQLGKARATRSVKTGTLINFSGRMSIRILFDGNKRPTLLHRSYIELVDPAPTNQDPS